MFNQFLVNRLAIVWRVCCCNFDTQLLLKMHAIVDIAFDIDQWMNKKSLVNIQYLISRDKIRLNKLEEMDM